MTFKDLVQKNVDHYDEHPLPHIIIPVVGVVVFYGGLSYIMQRAHDREIRRRTGRM